MKKLGKYIIVEIIPTTSKKETGEIIQIQALKIDDLKLLDRFDYRLDESKIQNQDLKRMINYDKDKFIYLDSSKKIYEKFKIFIEDFPLLIIENNYTLDYLKDLVNGKKSILKYLNLELSDDIYERIISKYNLLSSNHLVDLLYESLIAESNN